MKAIIILIAFVFFLHFANPVFALDPVINEFLPNPPSGSPEWVEFYNPADASVDLSDYYFDDDTNFDSDSGSSTKIALSGVLPTLQVCYWELSSYLNNNGDSPTFFKVQGGTTTTVDTYAYASSSAGFSYARSPDGGSWAILQQPTKPPNKCIDLAPTATPIPTSTPTPALTSTPTPTKTPTPTPVPNTPTSKPSATPTSKPLPTSILGRSTQSGSIAFPINANLNKKNTLISNESKSTNNNFQKIFIFLGIVFISVCAILSFRAIKKGKRTHSEEG